MSKRCASCTKAVYPVEELKCLDQIWHKTCFRCQECKMTLNMKNYKGYNKKPYCNAHYPTTKFTSVADTPESRRIAANTKIQSNIQYHKAFEDAKGKYTAVADDPETRRLKHNSDLISQVEYHGIRQKREVEERHRPELDAEENDAGIRGQQKRPVGKIADYNPAENVASPYSARTQNMPTVYDTEKGGAGYRGHRSMGFNYAGVKGQGGPTVGKIEDYAPQPYEYGGQQQLQQQQGYQDYNPPPPQQVQQPPPPKQGWTPVSFQAGDNDPGYGLPRKQPQQQQWQPNPPQQQQGQPSQPQQQQGQPSQPQQQQWQPSQPQQQPQQQWQPSPPQQQQQPQQQQWQPPQQKQFGRQPQQQQVQPPPQQQPQQQPWQAQGKGQPMYGQQQPQQQPLGYGQKQPQKQMGYGQKSSQPQASNKAPGVAKKKPVYPPPPKQPCYRAMYDYSAADTDEVSFKEGDVIIDVTPIDAGWMEGRVQRTGQYGMLPANYVERS